MNPILIVGAETVVGANLAVHLAENHDVFAVCLTGAVDLAGCRMLPENREQLSPGRTVDEVQPTTVVLCGHAARSSWEQAAGKPSRHDGPTVMRQWAQAAHSVGSRIVLVSTDAVFSGPWMFHDEDGESLCESTAAVAIRELESDLLTIAPETLVVRTNAYGWSPKGGEGWLENVLAQIEARRPISLDAVRHATPILASDLAEMIERMLAENLAGTFHVAGAERISPLAFAQRIAGQFNLPWLTPSKARVQLAPPIGFGAGECSLQTCKLRRELCIPMPLLSESLERLERQQIDGHREKLSTQMTVQLRAA